MAAALILVAILLFLVVLFLISAIKVAREYERGIVFRLGRLLAEPKGPGLFLLIPIVDRMVKVDLRTITLNIPPQEVITKDNVPVRVNAVAYFRIVDPKNAIVQVENFMVATSQIAQTTLRSVLGQHLLDELLSERDKINAILQEIIDEATAPWGIKVSIVEVKDVEIPSGMQRAMARQAEAERERRAKVIAAEGEFQASERLKDAALVIEEHPIAPPAALPADAARDRLLAVDDDRLPGADRPAHAVPRAAQAQLLSPDLRVDPLSGRLGRDRAGAVEPARAPSAARARAGHRRASSTRARSARAARTARRRRCSRCPRDARPDTPGWQVRVVPNLYPALRAPGGRRPHAGHARSLAELDGRRSSSSSPRPGGCAPRPRARKG